MMDNAEVYVHQFLLQHGASRYDPVKAHEYYERTKQLKGRRSTRGMNERQRKGLAYVRDQVGKEKKAATEVARTQRDKAIEQLRGNAEARRDVIRGKLKKIMAQLTARAETQRERVSDSVEAQIARLPEIPKGLPKARRDKLAAERRAKIDKIREQGSKDRSTVSTKTSGDRASQRESASGQRDRVRTELKASIDKARANYNRAKDQIKTKFESELDTEFASIKKNVR